MAYQFIISERLDGVALITLNRPEKLNALSFPLMEEVDHALTGYEADDDVKAVILTGAGERAFSAGADIHEMAGLSSEELARRSDTRGRISWHIASYTKPLIGAINGLAFGGEGGQERGALNGRYRTVHDLPDERRSFVLRQRLARDQRTKRRAKLHRVLIGPVRGSRARPRRRDARATS